VVAPVSWLTGLAAVVPWGSNLQQVEDSSVVARGKSQLVVDNPVVAQGKSHLVVDSPAAAQSAAVVDMLHHYVNNTAS